MTAKRWLTAAVLIATAGAASPAAATTVPPTGTIDLAEEGAADVRIRGLPAGSETGFSVASAGDVNGDGQRDMIVGVRSFDAPGKNDAGAAFVVFGSRETTPVDLANLGARGFAIVGAAANDHAGHAVSSAGDVNGDGRADLIVGAPDVDRAEDAANTGAAYVVFGKTTGEQVDLAALGAAGYAIAGANPGDTAGFAVSEIGDLNGDARGEILVGAPRHERTEGNQGAVYVVWGKASTDAVPLGDLADRGYTITGARRSYAGWSVAGMTDMSGDGKPDIAIGAPFYSDVGTYQGAAYVSFGKGDTTQVDLTGRFSGFGLIGSAPSEGNESGETLGGAVAPLPDMNGDGRPELAVGAPRSDVRGRPNGGAVYVVFGKTFEDTIPIASLGSGGFRIDGASDGDGAGVSVGSAGDFDGDGRGDILIGAPFADALSRGRSGAAYVVYGRETGDRVDLGALGERGVRIAGAGEGDATARSAVNVGDQNGDRADDLLIGVPFSKLPAAAEGETPPAVGSAELLYAPRVPVDAPPPDPGVAEEVEAGCRAARNIEVVIDDSGSMSGTDPERLRRLALELIITKPRNEGEVVGALEFGDVAEQLFPPQILLPPGEGSNQPGLLELIDRRIDADNGGTDYNAGFNVLADENPGAAARIFLTDGQHNVGEYQQGHAGGPPTYVIGLEIGRGGAAGGRLSRIASETGGKYYPDTDAHELQRVLNSIDSRLNCDIDVDTFETTVDADAEANGDDEVFDAELDEDTNSADVVIGWDDESDVFECDGIDVMDEDGEVLERISAKTLRRAVRRGETGGSAKVGDIRIKGRGARTYRSFRMTGLNGGQLRVRVRPTKLRGGDRPVLTTQVSESRRRG